MQINKLDATPICLAVSSDLFKVVQTLLAASVKMDRKIDGIDRGYSKYCCNPGWHVPYKGVPKSLLDVALGQADTDILLLLRKAGYNIQKVLGILHKPGMLNKASTYFGKYENRYEDNFYQDLIADWVRSSQSPARLESLCGVTVRKCLGHKIHRKVEELDIPIPLKNSLLLKDVLPSKCRLDHGIDMVDYY